MNSAGGCSAADLLLPSSTITAVGKGEVTAEGSSWQQPKGLEELT